MTSSVSICNLALANLGADNIVSLTEATVNARYCNQFYTHTLELLLASYPWKFAGKTVSLASVDNDKIGGWGYAYALPSDSLKTRYIRKEYTLDDNSPQTAQQEIVNPYEIEGSTLYCNLSPCFMRYTTRTVDPAKFSAKFAEALSWHLTTRLAMVITRDPKQRQAAFQMAIATQGMAEAHDANETRNWSDHDTEMLDARN